MKRKGDDMSETSGYPVLLKLDGRRCVVIGGGKVATRKVGGLLEANAHVIVVSPQVDAPLSTLAAASKIEIRQTVYSSGMLKDLQPFLVFAATNDAAVNQQVVEEAHALNLLVDTVDDASTSDFTSMARAHRGTITLGVATGGTSPALAARLKTVVSEAIGDEYVVLAQWVAELRPVVQQRLASESARAAFWNSVIESPILSTLRAGDESKARSILDELWADAQTNA
jgi:precorrin-2 dehydrogenase/sirohydrochlorin ferrochelatase